MTYYIAVQYYAWLTIDLEADIEFGSAFKTVYKNGMNWPSLFPRMIGIVCLFAPRNPILRKQYECVSLR